MAFTGTNFKPARGTWRADLLKRKAASKTEANKAIRQAKSCAPGKAT